jgi:tetratricopeptide (TPR) repeat protein
VRQDSALPGVWTKLGVAYKDKGCIGCRTKAIDSLKRATQLDPKDDVAWYEIGYLYKDDGRRPESIAAFRKYLELKPHSVENETVKDEIYYLQEESRRQP